MNKKGDLHDKKLNKIESLSILKDGAEKFPDSVQILTKLSNYYLNMGDYASSYKYAISAIQYEESAILFYNIGLYYFKTNELEKSLEYLKRAIEINPKDYKSYNSIGNIYRKMNDHQNALISYKKCEIYANGQFPTVYLNIGSLHMQHNKIFLGAESFRKAMDCSDEICGKERKIIQKVLQEKGYNLLLDPTLYKALEMFYEKEQTGDNFERIVQILLSKCENFKENVIANFLIAKCFKKLGKHKSSIDYFKKVLQYFFYNEYWVKTNKKERIR